MSRFTEKDLKGFVARGLPAQSAVDDLSKFEPNSGRGLPAATMQEMARAKRAKAPATPKKYRNTVTEVDGIRFDSKLEAKRYRELLLLQKAGTVRTFLRQVPFHLPGGVKYLADFLIFYAHADGMCFHPEDGFAARVVVEDCKGHQTRESKNKIKQVAALYGIYVKLVRSTS